MRMTVDYVKLQKGAAALIFVDGKATWRYRDGEGTTIDSPSDEFEHMDQFIDHIAVLQFS